LPVGVRTIEMLLILPSISLCFLNFIGVLSLEILTLLSSILKC